MLEDGWGIYPVKHEIHITPINDIKEHKLTPRCWCEPRITEYLKGIHVYSHNSQDGREFFENDKQT